MQDRQILSSLLGPVMLQHHSLQSMEVLSLDHQTTASMRIVLNCDPALVRLLASRIDAHQP